MVAVSVRAERSIVGNRDYERRSQGDARSVRLSYPEGLRSEIDGTLRLEGSPEALTLSGDVTLDRAIFSRNINLQSELLDSLSRARVGVPVDSFATRTRLDVQVRTRGIRVDNNLASMDASANLALQGTVAAPELTGTVTVREGGEFRLGRNTYRVESGRIGLQSYPVEPPGWTSPRVQPFPITTFGSS